MENEIDLFLRANSIQFNEVILFSRSIDGQKKPQIEKKFDTYSDFILDTGDVE